MNSEFYIGYLPKMPTGLKGFVKPLVIALLVVALLFSIVFALGQARFANSVFEFGNVRQFEGTLQEGGVPFLLVERTEKNKGLPTFDRYPLVGEGKHGVGYEVLDRVGKRVRLSGTLIYRDSLRMIEVDESSVKTVSENSAVPGSSVESLGIHSLKGEIIDSKCYLGVMNPGSGKVHRDCAVACLRGGVPALFVVKDINGNKSELWLLSNTGEAVNEKILGYVAEPVEITGRVTRDGDQLFFYINPNVIKRLD